MSEKSNELDIHEIERKWQDYWEKEEIYRYDPDSKKPVFSIDNPPRYASGKLHAGHAVHYTHIDFVARYKRMRGYNVFFPLCFDVNGMPIEVNVEKKYGIRMREYDRHKFIKLCEEFAQSNIGEMIRQFKVLGESMDPSIYYQTDDPNYRRLTQISFIRLYKKGEIYKGDYPVNWCPRCGTALYDAEVEYKKNITNLNYVIFRVKETGEDLIIATTRPELLATCQLVAINPRDERAEHLVGKTAISPIYERELKIVADERVDPEFGTGVVMICTIGDKDDLQWIFKYGLKFEKGIDEEGRMTDITGPYAGLTIKEARERIIKDLKERGLLVKQEEIEQNIGVCWRCGTPIEFIHKKQWFLKTLDHKEKILEMADEIKWYPEFMKIRLREWVESLSWDWVISRQRYFATPIPVWECERCGYIIPAEEEQCYVDPTITPPPVEKCPKCGGPLKGSEDVFDTWMDSSITPLYNTFWMRDEEKHQRLFPMSLRPQSHDIIRTWAFYTMLRSYLLTGKKPWNEIMMGGFILAPDGSPMHTSKGNVVDPLEIIKDYGTDPIRYFAAMCTLGKDSPFRMKDVKRGRQVIIKLWNIMKLVSRAFEGEYEKIMDIKWRASTDIPLHTIDKWLLTEYSRMVEIATKSADNYEFDKVVRSATDFLWHSLADNYLEAVKYRIYTEKDPGLLYTLYHSSLGLIKVLAPFMPHITEELYQRYFIKLEGIKSIHISSWPEPLLKEKEAWKRGERLFEIISAVRRWKNSERIALGSEIGRVTLIGPSLDFTEEELYDLKEAVKAKEIKVMMEAEVKERVDGIKLKFDLLGPKFREKTSIITKFVKSGEWKEKSDEILREGVLRVPTESGEIVVPGEFFDVVKGWTLEGRDVGRISIGEVLIIIDKT
ncbi:MAG: valine--tRNA ligase [Thermoplasmata archaeon]|nr:valine--tRNA ligase [Thermoplasmata archaeon]